MVKDGLWCAFESVHMGKHAELTAENTSLKKQVMHLLSQRPGASAAPTQAATERDDAPF